MDIRQPKDAALDFQGQLLLVDAEQLQESGMDSPETIYGASPSGSCSLSGTQWCSGAGTARENSSLFKDGTCPSSCDVSLLV